MTNSKNWNLSKVGNNYDQWMLYDDNDKGKYVGLIQDEANAHIASAAPEMLNLLQEIYDWTGYKKTPWAVKTKLALDKAKGI